MGIMDQVIGRAASSAIPRGSNPLIGAALQLLSRSGGVSGLRDRFQGQGLGPIADSWIGTGQNMPIQDHQLNQVFGQEDLSSIAREHGMPASDLTRQLSRFLPSFVNEMTPDGRTPNGQMDMKQLLSMGMRLLGR